MKLLKDVVVGFAIGIGIFVTVLVGKDAIEPRAKATVEGEKACYEVVSIKPELGVAITFNLCTGRFGLSQFPSDIRRKGPEPKDESSSSEKKWGI